MFFGLMFLIDMFYLFGCGVSVFYWLRVWIYQMAISLGWVGVPDDDNFYLFQWFMQCLVCFALQYLSFRISWCFLIFWVC